MDRFSYEILSLVKKQFEKVVGAKAYQVPTGLNNSVLQFYVCELADNLFSKIDAQHELQYGSGSGNELGSKMLALRSSSAMTFNLLGNGFVDILGDHKIGSGKYSIEYEKQLPTLSKGLPANLDAFLYNDSTQEGILCEMKMLEWLLNTPGNLSEAYLKKENYINEEAYEYFRQAAELLVREESMADSYRKVKFNRYDAFQMFKHTLAAYNGCCSGGKLPPVKKLTLVNCVWELTYPEILPDAYASKYTVAEQQEHAEFAVFQRAMESVQKLFQKKGIDFAIEYYSVVDWLRILQKSSWEKYYLTRYTFGK
jgi:hypothetical protein